MGLSETLKTRRSIYDFSTDSISDELIEKIVEEGLQYTPSAFNKKTQRLILLRNEYHFLFWDMIKEEIKKIVKKEDFPKSEEKINAFQKAQGTILLFDEQNETDALKAKFPLYAKSFDRWYLEQNGMLQNNLWLLLSENQIGASLQHYNELIEKPLKDWLNLPSSWKLLAQMPFGKFNEFPPAKPKLPLEQRMKIFK